MIPVLTYHAIGDLPPPLGLSVERFAAHVAWLQDHGIEVVPLAWALDGRPTEPRRHRAVAITFDDGYESVARHALPLLARVGFPATVFVVAGRVGKTNAFPGQPAWVPVRPLAGWTALREMRAAGCSIESHGLTHRRVDRLSEAELEHEFRGSAEEIGTHLGTAPRHVAYPYGFHSASARAGAARHFDAAWTATPGVGTPASGCDRYALPRVEAYDVGNPRMLRLLTSDALGWYLAMRRVARRLRRLAGRAATATRGD